MAHITDRQALEKFVRTQLLKRLRSPRGQDQLITIAIEDTLNDDLGLTSHELFDLLVELNSQLQVDPFARNYAITDIRTVADLCRIYRTALLPDASIPGLNNDASADESGADEFNELLLSRRRAQQRRQRRKNHT